MYEFSPLFNNQRRIVLEEGLSPEGKPARMPKEDLLGDLLAALMIKISILLVVHFRHPDGLLYPNVPAACDNFSERTTVDWTNDNL